METQISVYNVVWVDDEIDTLLAPMETKRILKRNSIEIIKARTSLEFRDIMEKRYDSIDAVITDANFSKFLTSNVDERDLSGFEDIKFPVFDGFWNQEIETPQNINFVRENVDNQIYNSAVLRRYMLLPQQTGTLTVKPAEMICQVQVKSSYSGGRSIFDDFFDYFLFNFWW